jgi:hypothetical protein
MQQTVPTGLAIATFWGFVMAALNHDPVSIDKKQIAVKTLAPEGEAARAEVIKQRDADAVADAAEKRFAEADEALAEVIKQREAAAAYAATLHAALVVFNESRREDAAAAEKRFAEADEKLAELTAEVRALHLVNTHLCRETEALSLELDNRDQNDSIFGGCRSTRSSPGQGARKSTGGRSPMRSTGGWSPSSPVGSSPLSR